MKKCCRCKEIKTLDNFHRTKRNPDGLQYYCIECNKKAAKIWYIKYKKQHKNRVKNWTKNNSDKNTAKATKYKNSKLNRTPKWLSKSQIKQMEKFYTKAAKLSKKYGIPYEVDHIIPLQGKNVSGLHVPWNLRVITAKQNRKKKNSFS